MDVLLINLAKKLVSLQAAEPRYPGLFIFIGRGVVRLSIICGVSFWIDVRGLALKLISDVCIVVTFALGRKMRRNRVAGALPDGHIILGVHRYLKCMQSSSLRRYKSGTSQPQEDWRTRYRQWDVAEYTGFTSPATNVLRITISTR